MKKDEFADLNKSKKKGNGIIIIIGIIALCITGVLYARKLQQESVFVSYGPDEYVSGESESV